LRCASARLVDDIVGFASEETVEDLLNGPALVLWPPAGCRNDVSEFDQNGRLLKKNEWVQPPGGTGHYVQTLYGYEPFGNLSVVQDAKINKLQAMVIRLLPKTAFGPLRLVVGRPRRRPTCHGRSLAGHIADLRRRRAPRAKVWRDRVDERPNHNLLGSWVTTG